MGSYNNSVRTTSELTGKYLPPHCPAVAHGVKGSYYGSARVPTKSELTAFGGAMIRRTASHHAPEALRRRVRDLLCHCHGLGCHRGHENLPVLHLVALLGPRRGRHRGHGDAQTCFEQEALKLDLSKISRRRYGCLGDFLPTAAWWKFWWMSERLLLAF